MAAQSDGIITPIQESAPSIQTILFSNDIGRVTIRQGQLIMFADATSYGEGYQNQQQEQQHTMTEFNTFVGGEIDHKEMPDLFFEESEELLE